MLGTLVREQVHFSPSWLLFDSTHFRLEIKFCKNNTCAVRLEGLFKKVMMHAYEVASRSIIRLPEAASAPSPSVQAESTSGENGQILN